MHEEEDLEVALEDKHEEEELAYEHEGEELYDMVQYSVDEEELHLAVGMELQPLHEEEDMELHGIDMTNWSFRTKLIAALYYNSPQQP